MEPSTPTAAGGAGGTRSRSSSLYKEKSPSSSGSSPKKINTHALPMPMPSSSPASSPAPSPSNKHNRHRSSGERGGHHGGGHSGNSSNKRQAGLSQKTLNIVNNLQPAAVPRKEREEEEEERLLALEEKRRAQLVTKKEAPSSTSSSLPSSSSASSSSTAVPATVGSGNVEYTEFMSIRILLLGDSGVGKTSLMMRYSEDEFAPCLLSTAGVDFKVRHLALEESKKKVKVQIWDTAGQERMHVITRTYYKGSHGIALIYNLTDPDSFKNVNYWMANIQQHAGDKVVKILIGNKADLTDRAITYEQGAAMAKEYGFSHFYETSAKTGQNVHEGFNTLAMDIVKRMEEAQLEATAAAAAAAAASSQGGGGKDKKQCVIS